MENEKTLDNFNVFLLIIITLLTCGIYIPVWYLIKAKILNKLNVKEKFGIFFIIISVIILLASIFFIISYIADKFIYIPNFDNIFKISELIITFGIILINFKIKHILMQYILDGNIEMNVSKWLTFFLSIYYLQYKMNRIPLIDKNSELDNG